jgi:hypothetical protein
MKTKIDTIIGQLLEENLTHNELVIIGAICKAKRRQKFIDKKDHEIKCCHLYVLVDKNSFVCTEDHHTKDEGTEVSLSDENIPPALKEVYLMMKDSTIITIKIMKSENKEFRKSQHPNSIYRLQLEWK